MSLRLKARVIEGADNWYDRSLEENGKYEFFKTENERVSIAASCNQEGFDALYNIGKKLWDAGMCSKFEIAAFDNGNMFWKYRPDKNNFQRNQYAGRFDEIIREENLSFRSEDFQNDKFEMEYVQNYQNKFWRGRNALYSVEAFEQTISDTKLYEDFNAVRAWVDRIEDVPESIGFEHNEQWINNPFYDETLRFEVEPFSYYGVLNVKFYIHQAKEIMTKPYINKDGDKFKKGDLVTVRFSSPDWPYGYAECSYSHEKDGKHYFNSETYDWQYIVDPVAGTVVNSDNPKKVYQLDNSTGWADRLLLSINRHAGLDTVISEAKSQSQAAERLQPRDERTARDVAVKDDIDRE